MNNLLIYDIADTLGMTIELDHDARQLRGKKVKTVKFDTVEVTFDQRIACSLVMEGVCMAMAALSGNLAALVVTTNDAPTVTYHLLNLAQMDHLDTWLSTKKPKTRAEALKLLGSAVVQSFHRTRQRKWEPA